MGLPHEQGSPWGYPVLGGVHGVVCYLSRVALPAGRDIPQLGES